MGPCSARHGKLSIAGQYLLIWSISWVWSRAWMAAGLAPEDGICSGTVSKLEHSVVCHGLALLVQNRHTIVVPCSVLNSISPTSSASPSPPIYHKYLLRLPCQITVSQDAHAGLICRFIQFISTFPPPSRCFSACLQSLWPRIQPLHIILRWYLST